MGPAYPLFVNEAAYYEKGVALVLARKMNVEVRCHHASLKFFVSYFRIHVSDGLCVQLICGGWRRLNPATAGGGSPLEASADSGMKLAVSGGAWRSSAIAYRHSYR